MSEQTKQYEIDNNIIVVENIYSNIPKIELIKDILEHVYLIESEGETS